MYQLVGLHGKKNDFVEVSKNLTMYILREMFEVLLILTQKLFIDV